jgi:CRP/FNR family transcriptional regulator/CRP/FNR family cyclic AMP-dependent transcriptional regulator
MHEEELLHKIDLFSESTVSEARRIAHSMRSLEYLDGETILLASDADTRALFFIVDGSVETFIPAPDGAETLIDLLGTGDFFGELSVFGGGTSSVSVRAASNCRLLVWPWDHIRTELSYNHTLSLALLDEMAHRVRFANRHVADLATLPVAGRVEAILRGLVEERGIRHKTEDGEAVVLVPMKLSQHQIAALSGTSRETVNRSLAPFIEKGELIFDEKGLIVNGGLI